MFNRFLSLSILIFMTSAAYAVENIEDFEDKSVPVLNEVLRNMDERIENSNIFDNKSSGPDTQADQGAIYTKDSGTQTELYFREESSGDEIQITNNGLVNAGRLLQIVNDTDSAVATSTDDIPVDDSIPQNDEGLEVLTKAITPSDSNNILLIEAVVVGSLSTTDQLTVALFQGSTANALAAITQRVAAAGKATTVHLKHYMTAGNDSSTTFKIRAGTSLGGGSSTFSFNGESGSRIFGGVSSSSLTIKEIQS